MSNKEELFLCFVAYCLQEDPIDICDFSDLDWVELYDFSQRQAISGIVFAEINRIYNNSNINISIPSELVYAWFAQYNQIVLQNKLINQRSVEITNFFKEKGFKCCILKGQGNAIMYPNPSLRVPGDIDVWLSGSKKEIVNFVHSLYPDITVGYHHMDFPLFDDVEVEVHYYPSFSYNYYHNHHLQAYFSDKQEEQFSNITIDGFAVPTKLFNIVFQLSHMMRHFFTQGIGLRHAIDYYYLLKQGISKEEEVRLGTVLKQCGMYKFFLSILWIEIEVLGLHVDFDQFQPNERAGRLVLHEMLKGGNFGKQYSHNSKNIMINYFNQFAYNLRYIREFPIEPLSRPITLSCDYIKRHVLRKRY